MRRLTPVIAVTNQSSVVPDADVLTAVKAVQHQVSYHFRPYWNETGRLVVCAPDAVPVGAWHLSILDDSDQAGALGYHDVTPDNTPLLKVFAKTDQHYGLSWTVTMSHEVLEALADPWISMAWQTTDTEFVAVEVGDPVEADTLGYLVDGVHVSDFVLPAWFVQGLEVPLYDFKGHLSKPLEVADGGYVSIYESGKGWTQKQQHGGRLEAVPLDTSDPRFRPRGDEDAGSAKRRSR